MKRELKSDEEIHLKPVGSPKAQERELSELITYMVDQMSRQFKNQTFRQMSQGDVDKFADAQTGNYATVFLRMANRVRRKLVKRFNDDRIDEIVGKMLHKVDKRNRDELYRLVEKNIGLSTRELSATEGLKANINALTLETTQWVKKLRDDVLEEYTAQSLRAMSHGLSLEEIMSQYDGLVEKRRDHVRFTARNQIANFNSVSTKMRAQNLGITEAVWVTSRDGERVRESHQDRDGKTFELSKGLYSSKDKKYLLPGVDYQCRCTYELIIPAN